MTKPNKPTPDIHGPRRDLAAFADGELDVEQNLAVLEHLAMHPEDTRRVMHQQQLRRAVATVMTEQTPATPADLRQRIESQLPPQLSSHAPRTTPANATQSNINTNANRPGIIATIGRWFPLAIAAMLFLSALVMWNANPTSHDNADGIVPVKQIERFASRHVTCSRALTELHNVENFPDRLEAMPDKLAELFPISSTPNLDLSALGYEFEKAGNCLIPGKDAVHMVYRAAPETGRHDSMSLWIKPYRGPDSSDHDAAIEPNRIYRVADAQQAHPMFVWRTDSMIYYLVGDSGDQVQRAAQSIAPVRSS